MQESLTSSIEGSARPEDRLRGAAPDKWSITFRRGATY